MFLNHIYLIPLFPAFGAAMMFFFGRRLQKATVNAVCVGVVVLAFLFACFTVVQYTNFAHGTGRPFEKIVYTWLGTGDGHLTFAKRDGTSAAFNVDAGFLLDPLNCIWLLFVTGVGMLIHIYSTGYMAHEGGYYRFFGYMNLFMFAMLTLILANNYILLFVGWEGVGLCSYLLIGFYFHRHSASTAANKAFIVNRIGDAGFILGALTLVWYLGSFRFTDINALARSGHFAIGDPVLTAAALLLFVGACGKSAQVPLYVWLPDAMEGPTPVSALIHAATMVTAGVYMVARSNAAVCAGADGNENRSHHWRADCDVRGVHRAGAERHQARAGLLYRFATGIHVPGARRRRIRGGRFPRLHARVLQSSAVPRFRLSDSCPERRAGHEAHGRSAKAHSDYL